MIRLDAQLKNLKSGFDGSTHSFLKAIAEALSEKFKSETGLETVIVGKTVSGPTITMSLTGSSTEEGIEERVRRTMDSLKTPATLIGLLG